MTPIVLWRHMHDSKYGGGEEEEGMRRKLLRFPTRSSPNPFSQGLSPIVIARIHYGKFPSKSALSLSSFPSSSQLSPIILPSFLRLCNCNIEDIFPELSPCFLFIFSQQTYFPSPPLSPPVTTNIITSGPPKMEFRGKFNHNNYVGILMGYAYAFTINIITAATFA